MVPGHCSILTPVILIQGHETWIMCLCPFHILQLVCCWNLCSVFGFCVFLPDLAHLACLPNVQYVLLALIIFFTIFNDSSKTNYLRIYWTDFHQIFTKTYVLHRRLLMATNFTGKIDKIGLKTFTYCSGIPKRIEILQFQWAR